LERLAPRRRQTSVGSPDALERTDEIATVMQALELGRAVLLAAQIVTP